MLLDQYVGPAQHAFGLIVKLTISGLLSPWRSMIREIAITPEARCALKLGAASFFIKDA